ncbi:MAG: SPOR domain-containing protein [Acidobacteriota bacterium]|jgi:cell division protein FtsN
MSDDQSFYEIQLNTPHLVLAFLGAAVVGVAIFWLGVVIGRGQSEVGGPSDWQGAVPAQQETAATSANEEDPLEFYEAVGEPTAEEPTAEEPTAGGAAGETEQATPPAQAESAPNERDFQAAEPVDEPRSPVVADSSATASGPEGLPRADASLVSGWIVQVRSTQVENEANALQVALARDGFPAFVVSVVVNGETWYRVRVGRYPSRGEAEQIETALLTRSDVETTWVTEG